MALIFSARAHAPEGVQIQKILLTKKRLLLFEMVKLKAVLPVLIIVILPSVGCLLQCQSEIELLRNQYLV